MYMSVMLFVYVDLKSDHLAACVLDFLTGLHLCTTQTFNFIHLFVVSVDTYCCFLFIV